MAEGMAEGMPDGLSVSITTGAVVGGEVGGGGVTVKTYVSSDSHGSPDRDSAFATITVSYVPAAQKSTVSLSDTLVKAPTSIVEGTTSPVKSTVSPPRVRESSVISMVTSPMFVRVYV
jgi:hypothetical protein